MNSGSAIVCPGFGQGDENSNTRLQRCRDDGLRKSASDWEENLIKSSRKTTYGNTNNLFHGE